MTEPQRTDFKTPAAPDAERATRIEELLVSGLDHYFAEEYEQAINVWTRVVFLDREHGRARGARFLEHVAHRLLDVGVLPRRRRELEVDLRRAQRLRRRLLPEPELAVRRELAAEGLFSAERKRPLPFLPAVIGLVCGRESAAQRDVQENAERRWPAVLQGRGQDVRPVPGQPAHPGRGGDGHPVPGLGVDLLRGALADEVPGLGEGPAVHVGAGEDLAPARVVQDHALAHARRRDGRDVGPGRAGSVTGRAQRVDFVQSAGVEPSRSVR